MGLKHGMGVRAIDWAGRHWVTGTLLLWLVFAVAVTLLNAEAIQSLGLRDTDDNLRMVQLRDWLAGQAWGDVRQYRMLAPEGADLHWTRLVELPLAALFLLAEPFVGAAGAERFAAAAAPLLALLVAMLGLGTATRRMIGPIGWLPAVVALAFAGIAISFFMPLRIDHHGWQLACLAWVMAGAVDRLPRRGGMVAGAASALSLAIGLEMLVPLALFGAGMVLAWVRRAAEARRMQAYGVTLALGVVLAFLLFAPETNRLARCDALTPVWLADMMLAGAGLMGLAWLSPREGPARLALAAGAGLALAAFHALAFPHCLSRLEGVSPDVSAMWLEQVREAKGVGEHSLRVAVRALAPIVVGLVGYAVALSLTSAPARRRRIALVAVPALVAGLLVFWQLRAAGAAQLLALPGMAALVVLLLPRAMRSGSAVVRVLGSVAIALAGLGVAAVLASGYLPPNTMEAARQEAMREVAGADDIGKCRDADVLGTLDAIAPATVFTHIDLAPRLIATTHHRAIVGPYHRNGEAIGLVLEAMQATREDDVRAEAIVRAADADYVLVCDVLAPGEPGSNSAQLRYRLGRGQAPDWLVPVDTGTLPIRLYSVPPAGSARSRR